MATDNVKSIEVDYKNLSNDELVAKLIATGYRGPDCENNVPISAPKVDWNANLREALKIPRE